MEVYQGVPLETLLERLHQLPRVFRLPHAIQIVKELVPNGGDFMFLTTGALDVLVARGQVIHMSLPATLPDGQTIYYPCYRLVRSEDNCRTQMLKKLAACFQPT